MTVFEQLVAALYGSEERLLSRAAIITAVVNRFGTNASSVIPADYCYNRWNRGVAGHKPLFVRVGTSEYRHLGPDYPYTGLVYWRRKGSGTDRVVGERVHGVLRMFEFNKADSSAVATDVAEPDLNVERAPEPDPVVSVPEHVLPLRDRSEGLPLSSAQLDRLYEEYMEILLLEVAEFGCKPTETRHLIGRLGEFFCARTTQGQLTHRVNQEGFDVVSGSGKRISVKVTAQRKGGFVSINANTVHLADELMLLRYDDGAFEVVFYGVMASAIAAARPWKNRYELDVVKARNIIQS